MAAKKSALAARAEALRAFHALHDDDLVSEEIAALVLDKSVAALQIDRHSNGTKPAVPYVRIPGMRAIRYRVGTLRQLIRASEVGRLGANEAA